MLQSIHDCKSFCWASRRVPAALVFGGDQPFIRRLIGVSTSPQVGSIYNMGVWDKAATCLQVDVRRTLDNEAAARHQYQVTGRSLDNGGCIAEPHIVVDRCLVFLCIRYCCMAISWLQVAFVEARWLGGLHKLLAQDSALGLAVLSGLKEWEYGRQCWELWGPLRPYKPSQWAHLGEVGWLGCENAGLWRAMGGGEAKEVKEEREGSSPPPPPPRKPRA